jgi:hypothetical protein
MFQEAADRVAGFTQFLSGFPKLFYNNSHGFWIKYNAAEVHQGTMD